MIKILFFLWPSFPLSGLTKKYLFLMLSNIMPNNLMHCTRKPCSCMLKLHYAYITLCLDNIMPWSHFVKITLCLDNILPRFIITYIHDFYSYLFFGQSDRQIDRWTKWINSKHQYIFINKNIIHWKQWLDKVFPVVI